MNYQQFTPEEAANRLIDKLKSNGEFEDLVLYPEFILSTLRMTRLFLTVKCNFAMVDWPGSGKKTLLRCANFLACQASPAFIHEHSNLNWKLTIIDKLAEWFQGQPNQNFNLLAFSVFANSSPEYMETIYDYLNSL